jgi:hypothetical protein
VNGAQRNESHEDDDSERRQHTQSPTTTPTESYRDAKKITSSKKLHRDREFSNSSPHLSAGSKWEHFLAG